MALATASWLAALTALVSLGYIAFGGVTIRRYEGIGVRSLSYFAIIWGWTFVLNSVLVFVVSVYGVTSGANLTSLSVPAHVELFLVSATPITELLTVAAIFGWLWFVLNYTTRLDRQDKIAIIVIGALVFLITSLNALIGALSSFGYISLSAGARADFHRIAGIIEILGTGVAVGGGIAQLYAASHRHPPFTGGAVASLTAPVLLPYLIRYTYQFGLVVEFQALELFRIAGLSLGLIGLWAAVDQYQIFEQLPASKSVGREAAFNTTETPIVVLDDKGQIADFNPAASTLFDVAGTDIVGAPLASVLPRTVDAAAIKEPGRTTFQFPNSDRIVEAETSVTTDGQDREIGRTTVYNDITDERRRQQRIQVLNRVLRHNLRNDLNVASGYVELLADDDADPEQYVPRISRIFDELVQTGGKAREVEEMLAVDPTVDSSVSLAELVEDAVASVRTRHDSASIQVAIPEDVRVTVNPQLLRQVLIELIENAVVHGRERDTAGRGRSATNDSAVVAVRLSDDRTITVTDTGGGIPEYELEVFRDEEETPLKHSSGLGLWMVKWGVDRFGGTVQFDIDETGTAVSVSIPAEFVKHAKP